jgi:hypothetical protein
LERIPSYDWCIGKKPREDYTTPVDGHRTLFFKPSIAGSRGEKAHGTKTVPWLLASLGHLAVSPFPDEAEGEQHVKHAVRELPGEVLRLQMSVRYVVSYVVAALVAVRCQTQVRAYYEHVQARGKLKMQALVAVMRKLLHAIYGMFKHNQLFEGQKVYAGPVTAALVPEPKPEEVLCD